MSATRLTQEQKHDLMLSTRAAVAQLRAKQAASKQAASSNVCGQDTLNAIAAVDCASPAGAETRQRAAELTSLLGMTAFVDKCVTERIRDSRGNLWPDRNVREAFEIKTAEPDGACMFWSMLNVINPKCQTPHTEQDMLRLRKDIVDFVAEKRFTGCYADGRWNEANKERYLQASECATAEEWISRHKAGKNEHGNYPEGDEIVLRAVCAMHNVAIVLARCNAVQGAGVECQGVEVFGNIDREILFLQLENRCHFSSMQVKHGCENLTKSIARHFADYQATLRRLDDVGPEQTAPLPMSLAVSLPLPLYVPLHEPTHASTDFEFTASVLEQDRKAHEVIAENNAELEAPMIHNEHASPEEELAREQLRKNAYVKRALVPGTSPVLVDLSVNMPTDAAAPWGLDKCRRERLASEVALHADADKREHDKILEEALRREMAKRAAIAERRADEADKRVAELEKQLADAMQCRSDTGKLCYQYDAENETLKERLLATEKLKNDQQERAVKAVKRALTAEMQMEYFMERAATAERHVLVQCAFDSLKRFAGAMIFRSTYVRSLDQYIARRITAEAFRALRSVCTDSQIMQVNAVAVQDVQDQSERVQKLEREVQQLQDVQFGHREVIKHQEESMESLKTQVQRSDLEHKMALRDNLKLQTEIESLQTQVLEANENQEIFRDEAAELQLQILRLRHLTPPENSQVSRANSEICSSVASYDPERSTRTAAKCSTVEIDPEKMENIADLRNELALLRIAQAANQRELCECKAEQAKQAELFDAHRELFDAHQEDIAETAESFKGQILMKCMELQAQVTMLTEHRECFVTPAPSVSSMEGNV